MKDLLKNARESKNIRTRELAELTQIDQALISKFENGFRLPTEKQIKVLSEVLGINHNELQIAWYKQRLLHNLDFNPNAIQAITEILEEKGIQVGQGENKENKIADILAEIDNLKNKLSNL
ncbi:helix-turn-helix transcriptional regulator [Flavobacterium sp.]|uniref:helix-turn-helix domain-containing protein n=1 Tax=Flavobacterium sp. TaxID=239 RepID=UPI002B4B5822|nr:helix-turn-helix transcriptional regulator [Flavobacterium sp.]HLP65131.1 helix-turn-helix transcriptional regulator [Flavobacterium sp.]